MCVHIKKINRCSIHGVFAAGELQAHDLRVRVAGAEAGDHLAGQELRPLVEVIDNSEVITAIIDHILFLISGLSSEAKRWRFVSIYGSRNGAFHTY